MGTRKATKPARHRLKNMWILCFNRASFSGFYADTRRRLQTGATQAAYSEALHRLTHQETS